MFKPITIIIASVINIDKPQPQKFYLQQDYSNEAREYLHNKTNNNFDPNDFMYKLIIQELQNKEQK